MLTKDVLEWNQQLLKILEAERTFDKSRNYFPGAKRENSSSTGSRLATATSQTELQVVKDYQVANELISESTPYGLHPSIFLIDA